MSRTALLCLLSLAAFSDMIARGQAPAPLTSVAEVSKVQFGDAGKGDLPAKLKGVILSTGPAPQRFVLHDGQAAIVVIAPTPMPELRAGHRVEIEGTVSSYSANGHSNRMIAARKVDMGEAAALPKPAVIGLPALNAFSKLDQWVSVEGFVVNWRWKRPLLTMTLVSHEIWSTVAVTLEDENQIPPKLHGARLKLTGVNTFAHFLGESLHVQGADQMQVLEPGGADAFDTKLASLAEINQRKVQAARRVRMKGTLITVMESRKLIVQDATSTTVILAADPRSPAAEGAEYGDGGPLPPLHPGDVIEAVGSIVDQQTFAMKTYGMILCYVRVIGKDKVPAPEPVSMETLLAYRNEGHWVTFEASVQSWMLQPNALIYAAGDQQTWTTISVRSPKLDAFPKDQFGARLRFTGLATGLALNFRGAEMLVPDPSFVQVIKPGSADPFGAPEHALADIAAGRAPKGERVKTKGVLVGQERSVLYVRGSDASLCINLQQPWSRPGNPPAIAFADGGTLPALQVGDEVEVAGHQFVSPRYAAFDLASANVRATGSHETVAPVETTLARVAAGEHTSDLVKVRGRLLSIHGAPAEGGKWRTTLLITSEGHRMTVVHQSATVHPFDTIELDDELILQAVVDRATPETPRQLWLFSAADVKSLGASHEVFAERLWLWGGVAVLGLGILGGWVFMLRRAHVRQARANAELKAATEAARASEQRWKLLFEQSPLSVQVFAPDGQTKRFNDAWRQLFRLSEEQGYAFNVLKDPDLNASGAVNLIRKAFEGEVVHVPPVPFPVQTDPPEIRWIGGVLYPVKNEAGEVLEVVTIHNDITEMKRAEEAMQSLNQTLEQRVQERTAELEVARADLSKALEQERELNELKSRFVSLVSHEFRTPLGVTMSAVEIMRHFDDRLTPERRRSLCEDIHSATRNMAELMEQVLLLGRVEAGKLGYKPVPADVDVIVRKLVDESLSATSGKCPVIWQPVGSLDGAILDESLLRHIFGNLIANAVKYSPKDSEVLFTAQRAGKDLVLEVIDHGIGIPEKDRAHLFEAFHRCSNVGEIPGTGLGLVIVKRCVDLHGGTIEIQSEVGKGTTFVVRLPVFTA